MSRFALTAQDSIGVWTWHEEPLNLLSPAALEELEPFVQKLEAARLSSLILLSGSAGGFHAGADLKALQKAPPKELSFFVSKAQSLYQRIARLPAFKIAGINGACMGGGLELALLFDFRLASLEKDTRFALPEVRLGLMPPLGGLYRLPRLIGLEASLKLQLAGRSLAVEEALRLGLADEAAPLSMLQKRAFEIAKKKGCRAQGASRQKKRLPWPALKPLLLRPFVLRSAARRIQARARGLPAPAAILQAVKRGLRAPSWEQVMEREREEFSRLLQSSESQNLIELFFMMKKAPQKALSAAMAFSAKGGGQKGRSLSADSQGKSPAPAASRAAKPGGGGRLRRVKQGMEIQTAAIAGAGAMGALLARLFAEKGMHVHLMDKDPKALRRALREAERVWDRREKSGALSARRRKALRLRIFPCMDLKSFRSSDLAIEAAFEDLNLKRKLAKEISESLRDEAMLATLTSSFTVGEIMRDASRPQRALGLHFFNPPDRMPLAELAAGKKTDSSFLGGAFALCRRIGKTAVFVPDSPGFIVNRLLAKYLSKALRLLTEGHSPILLDNIFSSFGFPQGPFRLMDEIGLDICLKSAARLKAAGIDLDLPEAALSLDQKLGRGRKEGRGFYLYSRPKGDGSFASAGLPFKASPPFFRFLQAQGRPLPLNPGLQEISPPLQAAAAPSLSSEEALERCLHPLIYEAARLPRLFPPLDEKDVDLAMILGAGWPPARGGPIAYGQAQGLI